MLIVNTSDPRFASDVRSGRGCGRLSGLSTVSSAGSLSSSHPATRVLIRVPFERISVSVLLPETTWLLVITNPRDTGQAVPDLPALARARFQRIAAQPRSPVVRPG
jgi:hypothetical protein